MKREQIEKAAKEYRMSLPYCDDPKIRGMSVGGYDGFIKGAEWRINSVWHKPSDIAEPGKDCLVEHMDGDGNVCIRIDWRSEYEWVHACHYDKILRWAYVSDLLPDGKEDKV